MRTMNVLVIEAAWATILICLITIFVGYIPFQAMGAFAYVALRTWYIRRIISHIRKLFVDQLEKHRKLN